jgi:hypothetical protein
LGLFEPTVTLAPIGPPISRSAKGTGKDAIITAGLDALEEKLLTREWIREDGAIMRIGKLLKDMGYEADSVRSQSRRSRFGDLTMPAKDRQIN